MNQRRNRRSPLIQGRFAIFHSAEWTKNPDIPSRDKKWDKFIAHSFGISGQIVGHRRKKMGLFRFRKNRSVQHIVAESHEEFLRVKFGVRLVRLPQRNVRYLIDFTEQGIGVPALVKPLTEGGQIRLNAVPIDVNRRQTAKWPVVNGGPRPLDTRFRCTGNLSPECFNVPRRRENRAEVPRFRAVGTAMLTLPPEVNFLFRRQKRT